MASSLSCPAWATRATLRSGSTWRSAASLTCVISGGLVKWTDPVVKSRFQGNPDYYTEGRMLGKYIAQNYNGKTVGLLL